MSILSIGIRNEEWQVRDSGTTYISQTTDLYIELNQFNGIKVMALVYTNYTLKF